MNNRDEGIAGMVGAGTLIGAVATGLIFSTATEDFWETIYDYQTLIVGMLALIGIPYLARQTALTRQHMRDEEDRKFRSGRALLPIALLQVSQYVDECSNTVREHRRIAWDLKYGHLDGGTVDFGALCKRVPKDPEGLTNDTLTSLQRSAYDLPAGAVEGVSDILNWYQVSRARLAGRNAEVRELLSGQALSDVYYDHIVDDLERDLIALHSLNSRMFDVARDGRKPEESITEKETADAKILLQLGEEYTWTTR